MNKEKLVLHICNTSLAGAPIRLVNALNKYTNYSARLVNYFPSEIQDEYMYQEDLNWQIENEKKEAIALIKQADIIHFHHYMDLNNNTFIIDFPKSTKPGCKFVKQFHSSKDYVAKTTLHFQEYYTNDNCTKVVIPHCPERTFLEYEIVPNIMPINDEIYKPKQVNNKKLKIAYSASNKNPLSYDRWNTKGYNELSPIMKSLSEKLGFEYNEIVGMKQEEAMKVKQNADIIIGDVITGSYHLTELEGLSLGKPTLSFLDGRSVMTFLKTFETEEVPFVNVSLNELEPALTRLIEDSSLRENIGKFSREWIEKHYQEETLIKRYCDLYNKLLNDEIVYRKDYNNYEEVKKFLYNEVYDYRWETFKSQY